MRESKVSRTAQKVKKTWRKAGRKFTGLHQELAAWEKAHKNTRMGLKDTGESDQVKAG